MPRDRAFKSKINLLVYTCITMLLKKWLKDMSLTLEVIDRSVQGINHSMAIALEFDWEIV